MNPLTSEHKAELLELALATAREAGVLIAKGYRKRPPTEHKGPIDLVTTYDRESERFIRERLSKHNAIPIVGEEEGGQKAQGTHEATWYVDPLDGTTNFIHGHPFYCVSIGLFIGRTPVLGAVVAPALRTEWTGIVGGIATRNGEPVVVSAIPRLSNALLTTGFPYDRAISEDNNFNTFVTITRQCQAVRHCGSAAIDLCFVADGTYDGYWERKLKSWDMAAGVAIVLAAGGAVSAYNGGAVDISEGHVLASNGIVHRELMSALATAYER